MAQYNPMPVRLQRKIEEHNKNVQQTIDKVATRQKFITIGAITINLLILFLTNFFLPDDSQDASNPDRKRLAQWALTYFFDDKDITSLASVL